MYNNGMNESTKKFITVKEASGLLGVTPLTLRNWDKQGKLLAGRHPFNNYRVYLREDIDRLLTEISTSQKTPLPRVKKNLVRKLEVVHL